MLKARGVSGVDLDGGDGVGIRAGEDVMLVLGREDVGRRVNGGGSTGVGCVSFRRLRGREDATNKTMGAESILVESSEVGGWWATCGECCVS
jgi:hypothetical protein